MVKITIKELYSSSENNTIYSVSSLEAIKKIENASHSMSEQFVQALSADAPLSTINLTLLFKHVNSPDILRYIPDELLSGKQITIKQIALEKYNKKKEWQKNKKE